MDPIVIDATSIRHLDLSPLRICTDQSLNSLLDQGPILELNFHWPRDARDPRELAECPEPRLWALRADARYPWLPLILERDRGSLIRHVAMVVSHTFNRSEGLRFDPQALDLWLTHRLMQLDELCNEKLNRPMRGNLSQMAVALGYELNDSFWALLN
ncbi:CRR6 family NdhI maturation factor [Synechococcus sp. M16CYN]|uniref:CRR6 family NdhI maturation factor n=1 Tax=Synechococcus sp. M16CYN TaxID=3103139 RepID=UPI003249F867